MNEHSTECLKLFVCGNSILLASSSINIAVKLSLVWHIATLMWLSLHLVLK